MAELRFISAQREYDTVFTRAGPASLDGVVFGPDQVRVLPAGVTPVALVEVASSNLFLNSSSPAEQSITASGVHTVSTSGVGRVLLNGGSLGVAMQGRPVTVTWSGAVTVTPEGTLDWVQVEPGAIATSHIRTEGTPVARAAEAWDVDVPVSGLLNVAGVLQPNRPTFTPWLAAGGLSVGQEGYGVRIILDSESVLVSAPLGWTAVTLLNLSGGTRVVVNNKSITTLPVALDYPAPIAVDGSTFVSFGSYPLRVPHVRPSGGDAWQHKAWLDNIRQLGVEPKPLNVMDLQLGRGTFYHAIW